MPRPTATCHHYIMIKIVIIKNGQNGNCGCYIVVRTRTTMSKQLPRALACNGQWERTTYTENQQSGISPYLAQGKWCRVHDIILRIGSSINIQINRFNRWIRRRHCKVNCDVRLYYYRRSWDDFVMNSECKNGPNESKQSVKGIQGNSSRNNPHTKMLARAFYLDMACTQHCSAVLIILSIRSHRKNKKLNTKNNHHKAQSRLWLIDGEQWSCNIIALRQVRITWMLTVMDDGSV